jgi:hypothetical protein
MFSTEELLSKYEKYTDDELFEVHSSIDTYSDEAKNAFNIVLSRRGGLEHLMKQQTEKRIILNEVQRIRTDVARLNNPDVDTSFIKKIITSDILPAEKVNEVIDSVYSELELDREDKKIKPRTIWGSLIGGTIASVLGGVLWGLQLIYSKKIFLILVAGLILLCYGIIKLSTKQSNKNVLVLITTIISIIIAMLIGQLLYEIVGYRE